MGSSPRNLSRRMCPLFPWQCHFGCYSKLRYFCSFDVLCCVCSCRNESRCECKAYPLIGLHSSCVAAQFDNCLKWLSSVARPLALAARPTLPEGAARFMLQPQFDEMRRIMGADAGSHFLSCEYPAPHLSLASVSCATRLCLADIAPGRPCCREVRHQ